MTITLLRKQEAAQILGVKPRTLLHYREINQFVEGIHYYRFNDRNIRYVKESLEHWRANRRNPEAHQRYCEQFVQTTQSAS
jgi:DNA-binding transcriptional MerR regulator